MNHHYNDITSRIEGEPVWFDENAVPRYCEFSPGETANIYSNECCLVEVTCQGCGRKFLVAFSVTGQSLRRMIAGRELHYGDPPNVGCCGPGPSMNSEPRRVVQFWSRATATLSEAMAGRDWTRLPEFEVDITPDWVEDVA